MELDPGSATAWNGLGVAWMYLEHANSSGAPRGWGFDSYDEGSIFALRKTLAAQPGQMVTLSNLVLAENRVCDWSLRAKHQRLMKKALKDAVGSHPTGSPHFRESRAALSRARRAGAGRWGRNGTSRRRSTRSSTATGATPSPPVLSYGHGSPAPLLCNLNPLTSFFVPSPKELLINAKYLSHGIEQRVKALRADVPPNTAEDPGSLAAAPGGRLRVAYLNGAGFHNGTTTARCAPPAPCPTAVPLWFSLHWLPAQSRCEGRRLMRRALGARCMRSMFGHHNKQAVFVLGFPLAPSDDSPERADIRRVCDGWVEGSNLTDVQARARPAGAPAAPPAAASTSGAGGRRRRRRSRGSRCTF